MVVLTAASGDVGRNPFCRPYRHRRFLTTSGVYNAAENRLLSVAARPKWEIFADIFVSQRIELGGVFSCHISRALTLFLRARISRLTISSAPFIHIHLACSQKSFPFAN